MLFKFCGIFLFSQCACIHLKGVQLKPCCASRSSAAGAMVRAPRDQQLGFETLASLCVGRSSTAGARVTASRGTQRYLWAPSAYTVTIPYHQLSRSDIRTIPSEVAVLMCLSILLLIAKIRGPDFSTRCVSQRQPAVDSSMWLWQWRVPLFAEA